MLKSRRGVLSAFVARTLGFTPRALPLLPDGPPDDDPSTLVQLRDVPMLSFARFKGRLVSGFERARQFCEICRDLTTLLLRKCRTATKNKKHDVVFRVKSASVSDAVRINC